MTINHNKLTYGVNAIVAHLEKIDTLLIDCLENTVNSLNTELAIMKAEIEQIKILWGKIENMNLTHNYKCPMYGLLKPKGKPHPQCNCGFDTIYRDMNTILTEKGGI